ncbi:glycosyltransferase [Rufibacter latericius]|uniref:Glycosyltransferase n=1 Tax=Rufibacter latericius TaxID=2487040 RepID=A0A3M9N0Y7_9BACT|nr:glycosyltransferase family 2 protein [Rufibacter latericius]RNI31451.1 glycosyltransferase [Rufibacter latericius]
MLLTGYAVLITFAWVIVSFYLLIYGRRVKYLKNISPNSGLLLPPIAIIVAVKDEEVELEQALSSICQVDYPKASILVINDRSTDRTPQILEKMVRENPAISVVTVQELPPGWLGKNYALYQGYLATSEEWMLFTDADVMYNRQALKKAMQYVEANRLDHLTAMPEITSPSGLFKSVMSTFAIMLELRQRPWDVRNPKSNASIGIGAFNLVNRTAYEQAGTHQAFSLRPDDDLKLGERIKAAGLRQDVVYGEKEISLKWYTSLHEFVRGLMKNTFSVTNYHLPTAVGMAVATLLVFVLPLPLLLLTGPTEQLLALALLVSQFLLMHSKSGIQGKGWHALMIPFAGAVIVYILIASAVKTIRQGGIYWRDSFYPLEELKKQR